VSRRLPPLLDTIEAMVTGRSIILIDIDNSHIGIDRHGRIGYAAEYTACIYLDVTSTEAHLDVSHRRAISHIVGLADYSRPKESSPL
jgi:hypothetical protein